MKDARFEQFRAFEDAAFLIMARYGAKVVSVTKNHASKGLDPHEVHVLEFPDLKAFDAYRSDSKLIALVDMRNACIAKTEVEFS